MAMDQAEERGRLLRTRSMRQRPRSRRTSDAYSTMSRLNPSTLWFREQSPSFFSDEVVVLLHRVRSLCDSN